MTVLDLGLGIVWIGIYGDFKWFCVKAEVSPIRVEIISLNLRKTIVLYYCTKEHKEEG
jgi:hypothetical protein